MKMPMLFLGHGSPMNAIATNEYTHALSKIGGMLPTPSAILCISAHWMTEGTFVTHMQKPKTIHDFYGFPKPLYDIQYPAPGSPKIAEMILNQIQFPIIKADDEAWGLDHGSWSVLRHLYPSANIPVLQLSLDMTEAPEYHFELGKKLNFLREHGVLILSSGNLVHNLRTIDWNESAPPPQWAIDFDQWVNDKVQARDYAALINDFIKTAPGKISVPTPDHYYPLLYVLGASPEGDQIQTVFEGFQNASISMRCYQFG